MAYSSIQNKHHDTQNMEFSLPLSLCYLTFFPSPPHLDMVDLNLLLQYNLLNIFSNLSYSMTMYNRQLYSCLYDCSSALYHVVQDSKPDWCLVLMQMVNPVTYVTQIIVLPTNNPVIQVLFVLALFTEQVSLFP